MAARSAAVTGRERTSGGMAACFQRGKRMLVEIIWWRTVQSAAPGPLRRARDDGQTRRRRRGRGIVVGTRSVRCAGSKAWRALAKCARLVQRVVGVSNACAHRRRTPRRGRSKLLPSLSLPLRGERRPRLAGDLWEPRATRSVRGRSGLQPCSPPAVVEADADALGLGGVHGHFVAQPALPEQQRAVLGGDVDEAAVF